MVKLTIAGRIIPAYAGSTMISMCGAGTRADHPRIRGEHCVNERLQLGREGSSPHTRGALDPESLTLEDIRIIPAYAGSTDARRSSSTVISDHPRIRGEHLVRLKSSRNGRGSSPHTRGAPASSSSACARRRIIPAYAGSTRPRRRLRHRRQDHPRIRGEHVHPGNEMPIGEGSSPHTRGARPTSLSSARSQRIIPAYAGSTPPRASRTSGTRDHPRIRGEHKAFDKHMARLDGSSPHTRGARTCRPGRDGAERIIPAYAGSTFTTSYGPFS